MATDRETIKSWFETGDTPTEEQFAEALDSYVHKDDLDDVAKESTSQEINSKVDTFAKELDTIKEQTKGVTYPAIEMVATTATIEPNKLYMWGEVAELTITLANPTDTTIVNEYMMQFVSGDTATSVTFTDGSIQFQGSVGKNKIVSISILNKSAVIA